jgi:hypothetical protein
MVIVLHSDGGYASFMASYPSVDLARFVSMVIVLHSYGVSASFVRHRSILAFYFPMSLCFIQFVVVLHLDGGHASQVCF